MTDQQQESKPTPVRYLLDPKEPMIHRAVLGKPGEGMGFILNLIETGLSPKSNETE